MPEAGSRVRGIPRRCRRSWGRAIPGEAEAVAVSLREFAFAVGLEQQRQMHKLRHSVLPAEGFIEEHVQGRGGEPFLTANYVRHLHKVVVDNVGQMICREVVGALVEHFVVENAR